MKGERTMADDKILDNEEFDDDAEYITLQFDDSEDIECEILGIFDFEEGIYRSAPAGRFR